VLFGQSHIIIHRLQVAIWKRCPFCVNWQNIQNNVLTYKNNLKSITNIATSKSVGGMGVCSYECWVLSGTYLCVGSIKIQTRSRVCVCVSVLVCLCVSARARARVCVCVCVCVCEREREKE